MHFNKLSKQSSLRQFPNKLSTSSPWSPKVNPDQALHQTVKRTNKENPSQAVSNFFLTRRQNFSLLGFLLQIIQAQVDLSSRHNINNIQTAIQGFSLAQCRSIVKKIFQALSEKDNPYRSPFKTSEMLDSLKTQKNSRESVRNNGNGSVLQENSSVSALHNKVNRMKKTNVNIEFDLSPIYEHIDSLENKIKELKDRGQQKDEQIEKLLDNIIVLNEELTKEESAHEETLKQVDKLKDKQVEFQQMVKQLQGLYLGKCQTYTKMEEEYLKLKEESEEHERYLIELDKINHALPSKARNKQKTATRHLSLDLLNQNININQQQLDCCQSEESSKEQIDNNKDDNLLRCLLVQAQSIQSMLQNQNACC